MPTRAQLESHIRASRVRFVPKPASRLMRGLAPVLRLVGNTSFMDHYWTTIGRTIYTPGSVEDPLEHPGVVEHELVHVAQYERWGWLFMVSYLLLPLPLGLAWFRWRWEREAYMVQIRQASDPEREIERVVASLWTGYGWPWPRGAMRAWFRRAAGLTRA